MKPILIILLIALFQTSCKKSKPAEIVQLENLTGKWRWIYSYIDIPLDANNPLTPANKGITEGMEYTYNMVWRKWFNNEVVDSGTFELEHGSFVNESNAKFIYDQISYYKNDTYIGADYYTIRQDTLVFDPGLRYYFTSLNVHYFGGTKWFVKE